MTCPASTSAFEYAREHIFGEASFNLFDGSDDELEELRAVIQADQPTPATLRLRCFFAIECAVYVALKAAFVSTGSSEVSDRLSEVLPIERSYEGLTRLLASLEDIEKSLRVDQLELNFMGDHANELGRFNAKLLERPKVIVSYIIRMVRALRPDLGREHVLSAREVGEYLGRVLSDAFPDPATCFYWIRRMLNTSMENPTTWNTTTRSLV
jgi:hypothetical protein